MSTEGLVKKRKEIFPGWSLLIAGSVMCFWGYGIFSYSFGAYVNELIKAFGWSRAQVSLAFSFRQLEGGIEGPFGGIATDKWGPRVVNLFGYFLFGCGLCTMYLVNNLWQFYLAWILTSIGANLGLGGPLDAAVANWFVKRRGLMVGIMKAAQGASGTALPLIMLLLIAFGWRQAFLLLGIGTLLIGVPLTWFFVKPKRPEYYGWLPDGKRIEEVAAGDTEVTIDKGVKYATETTGEVEFTIRQALRDRIWWICALAMILRAVSSPVVMVHMIPYLTDMGIDPIKASVIMGSSWFMLVPSRVLVSWLGDIVPINRVKYVVMAAHVLEALGIFLIIRGAPDITWTWIGLGIWSFGMGSNNAWVPMRGRYWGRKAYATIQGSMMPLTMIAGIGAPVYAGWAFDSTGTYMTAFTVVLICLVLSTAVVFFANPPKPPEKVSKITERF